MFFKNVVNLESFSSEEQLPVNCEFLQGMKMMLLEIVSVYYFFEHLVLSKKWQREARIKKGAS